MSTEQIVKLQPDRTLYLRGFDGAGAAAALYQTSLAGFSVSGVFRDMADFCVLVIYDADNTFEHYSLRYLPDFNLAGMTLSFDVSYQGLQGIDSAKYSWIDWAQLDVISATGGTRQIVLWDHAMLASGSFTPAQGSFTISAGSGCTIYDRLTLFVNNTSFDFVAQGGESADYVAAWFATYINSYNWASFANSSVSVMASTAAGGVLTLKYARTGYVNVSGTDVTWTLPLSPNPTAPLPAGIKFSGLAAGSTIYIGGAAYLIASVASPTSLALTTDPSAQGYATYLAEYGGADGNGLTVYMIQRPPNVNLQVNTQVLPLSGGNSNNVTWNIQLDFTALGIDSIRQAWLTFAPQLTASGAYADTEWTANFTNWATTDPNNISTLQIAGPDSSRTGNADSGCGYSKTGWNVQSANNYWRGFAMVTDTPGSTVIVTYSNPQTHDLYLGTSLYIDRGVIGVSVDADTSTTLDCYLNTGSELVTRRLLRSSLPPGTHTVSIALATSHNPSSSGTNFIFDYIEAAVSTPNIRDAAVTYSNVSPALDYDTDATYKMSPQRIMWHLDKLGLHGHMNEYLGVFWWNQRVRAGGSWTAVTVTVGGTWQNNDYAELNIGGFVIRKSVITWDTPDTIANHFVYYINSATVATWAAYIGAGQFTIYIRTPNWSDPVTATAYSATGTFAVPANSSVGGTPGYWQVDATAANPLNFAIRQWHADLFNEVKTAGRLITTSFSMELVYPPDDGTIANAWVARFYDGTEVSTDTGFAHLVSSQCAFIASMTAFQERVYLAMAALQSAAGLTPWLQFGEFLWWFFPSSQWDIQALGGGDLVIIGVTSHGMSTGDRVVVSGVNGCTSANGTWPISVIDNNNFSIPIAANGTWTAKTGSVRGGSMAYYDAVTTSAAETALGRPLYKFTCQDDDPGLNGGADAAFLAGRLKAHIDAIRSAVLAQFPNAKFEILYPNDVNNPVCLTGPGVPYSQGGRLNAAVNLPAQFLTQPGSGLDSFKVEALSWSATYLNMDLAQQAIVFAVTPPMAWDTANVAYLIPWFNGTCPWPREFLSASSRGLNIVNFWAYDHLALMSWPIPLPVSVEKTVFLG
jgi:hypothetical protein